MVLVVIPCFSLGLGWRRVEGNWPSASQVAEGKLHRTRVFPNLNEPR
jgi:hypothetical protein